MLFCLLLVNSCRALQDIPCFPLYLEGTAISLASAEFCVRLLLFMCVGNWIQDLVHTLCKHFALELPPAHPKPLFSTSSYMGEVQLAFPFLGTQLLNMLCALQVLWVPTISSPHRSWWLTETLKCPFFASVRSHVAFPATFGVEPLLD